MKTIEEFQIAFCKEPWNSFHGKEWKRVARIGSGSFAAVYIGQRVEDGMVFAVKSTDLAFSPETGTALIENLNALRNEIIKLSQLRCKYIVRMLGCGRSNGKNSFQADQKPMLDLFLEYIPRGSLHHLMSRLEMGGTSATTDVDSGSQHQSASSTASKYALAPSNVSRVKRLPEDYVRAYTADILRGVDYLHRKQFVHGDIKPLNLLVAEDCLKLADFGGCKTLKMKRADSLQIHTSKYSAPEVYYKVEQGLASDIFSVGCTVLEMTAGFVPSPIFIPQWLSKDGQNFLRRSLTSDPTKRWTAAQLLEHPFIRGRDQNDTRPYSTIIPPEAERMVLQPPPIELYTNTMLSPTYRGNRSPLAPTDPRVFYQRIYDNPQTFRKEKITISSEPPPPQTKDPDDSDSSYFSLRLSSRLAAANPAPTQIHPVQLRIGGPVLASMESDSSSSNAPPTKSPSNASNPTPQPDYNSDVSSRPAKRYKADPQCMDTSCTSAAAFRTAHSKLSDDLKDAISILPDYKPEFEPPEDRSLHFLLPGPPPREQNNLYSDVDMDAQAAALLKQIPNKMTRRPSPLLIPDQSPDSTSGGQRKKPEIEYKYVTLLPDQISNLSNEDLRQLHKNLPNLQEYNEDIREEARMAEEAGIYHNKLCPSSSDEEDLTSWRSPPRILSDSSNRGPEGYLVKIFRNCSIRDRFCMDMDGVHCPM